METTRPPQDDYRQDDRLPAGKLLVKAQARPQAILWNTPELAAYFNVKEGTIRYWVHVIYIPHIKFQSLVRFRKTDIDAWLDQRTALGRTTFASLMLSHGEDPLWIARMLGHTTLQMVFQHYGKFIQNRARKDGLRFTQGLAEAGPVPSVPNIPEGPTVYTNAEETAKPLPAGPAEHSEVSMELRDGHTLGTNGQNR